LRNILLITCQHLRSEIIIRFAVKKRNWTAADSQ